MAVTESAIVQLCEQYRYALESIEREPDPIEREIGRAAHRLEATQMYARLASAGGGLSDEALESFGNYVAGLSGAGELAEWTVDVLDASARQGSRAATYALTQLLLRKMLGAGLAFVIGVASGLWLSAQQFGAALVPVALAVGIFPFVWWAARGLHFGVGTGWVRTWRWATRLGKRSDQALAVVRSLQLSLWESTGAVALPAVSFTTRARRRAMVVVGLSWVAALLGIAAVISGFLNALEGSDVCIDPEDFGPC